MYAFDEHGYFVVPEELDGKTVEAVLEFCLAGVQRSAMRKLLIEEKVEVNGRLMKATKSLREGDVVSLASEVEIEELPKHRAKSTPLSTKPEVLFEDDSCLVLDKPSGLASVPDRQNEPSVHAQLEDWFPGQDLRIVHRLDRGTSGVLILGKGKEGAQAFDQMFREREVHKVYLALVRGYPVRDDFSANFPIGRTISRGRVRIGNHKGSREALTEFSVITRYRGFALLEARPLTGRMHQIRAHLMWMQLSLAVDPLYKGADGICLSEFKRGYQRRSGGEERPLISRLTLHASRARFTSPASGEEVEVASELPKDLALILSKLDRFADPIGVV